MSEDIKFTCVSILGSENKRRNRLKMDSADGVMLAPTVTLSGFVAANECWFGFHAHAVKHMFQIRRKRPIGSDRYDRDGLQITVLK